MTSHRFGLLPLLVAGLILLGLTPVHSSTFESGDIVRISPLHEIDDDFYAYGGQIVVEGTVLGDLTGLSSETTIKGSIRRSANLACRYAEHNGSIDGSLRWFGDRLTVTGRVGGSVLAVGSAVMIKQGSIVEKDLNAAANEINLEGNILGNVDCDGGTIRISGQIGGDVRLEAERITIVPPAVIRGNLTCITKNEDQLTLEPGVTVIGKTVWQPPDEAAGDESGGLTGIAFKVANILAAFIFGIIVFSFFRTHAEESFDQLRNRPTVALAAGLLGLLGLAFAIVMLGLALIGAAAGSVLLSGELAVVGIILLVVSILMIPIASFVTVSGAVVFYSGMIVVGMVLGYLILKSARPSTIGLSKPALFLGLIVLTVACSLPYVGIVVFLLSLLVGSGAVILGIHSRRQNERAGAQAPTRSETAA